MLKIIRQLKVWYEIVVDDIDVEYNCRNRLVLAVVALNEKNKGHTQNINMEIVLYSKDQLF